MHGKALRAAVDRHARHRRCREHKIAHRCRKQAAQEGRLELAIWPGVASRLRIILLCAGIRPPVTAPMSIWKSHPTLEQLNIHSRNTLSEHLGIRVTEIGPDYLRATMPVDSRTHQPMGVLHGGASVALAETLGSLAAGLCLDREKYTAMGQDINANHLRPVSSGIVTATATAFHIGKRSHVWHIEIHDEAGKLTCVSRLTMAVVAKEPKTP
jgi:1,4-dihydroxy-2-naphthoyl-CoA hydrolase